MVKDDLTDKQKKRQIKRVHALLFDYQEESEEEGKSIVSLAEPYMSIFNSHFPVGSPLSVIELEQAIFACTGEILAILLKENDSLNDEYSEVVIMNIILQFVQQAISIVHADDVQTDASDFMYN